MKPTTQKTTQYQQVTNQGPRRTGELPDVKIKRSSSSVVVEDLPLTHCPSDTISGRFPPTTCGNDTNLMGRFHKEEAPDKGTSGAPLRSGFTLIELLVVVLIIGILAAVAVPQYQKAVFKSRVKSAIPTLRAISRAKTRYYLANGSYTNDLDALDVDLPYTSQNNGSYTGTPLKGIIQLSSTGQMVMWYSPYGFSIEVYNDLAVCYGTDLCAFLGPVHHTTAGGTVVYTITEQ